MFPSFKYEVWAVPRAVSCGWSHRMRGGPRCHLSQGSFAAFVHSGVFTRWHLLAIMLRWWSSWGWGGPAEWYNHGHRHQPQAEVCASPQHHVGSPSSIPSYFTHRANIWKADVYFVDLKLTSQSSLFTAGPFSCPCPWWASTRTQHHTQSAWIQAPPGNPQPRLAHGPGEQRGCISQVVSAGGQGLCPAVLQRYLAQTHPIPAILMSRDSSMKRAGNRMLVSCFLGADPFHVSPVIGYFKVILFQHLHLNKMSLE